MFVLFRDVPYEGRDLLGVYSSIERAIDAARVFIEGERREDGGFDGRCLVFRAELDRPFRLGFLEQPLWESAGEACY